MKTSELIGPALDWAVAKCEGQPEETLDLLAWECTAYPSGCYNYSTSWAQGGPIIERHCINLFRLDPKSEEDTRFWLAHVDGIYCRYGPTPLIAAMRCFVASKLGDDVEIPEELK